MVSTTKGFILNLFAKYTMLSTFSLKSSKKSLQNVTWEVAPVSISYGYLQEGNEVLNKYLVTPILKWETM
jgi:hypothetical protein